MRKYGPGVDRVTELECHLYKSQSNYMDMVVGKIAWFLRRFYKIYTKKVWDIRTRSDWNDSFSKAFEK